MATNQTFSLEFFNGLSLLGEDLPAADQEAWFYTWKRIGQIMGVQDELVCSNVKEAWTLQHAVYDHLFHDDRECQRGNSQVDSRHAHRRQADNRADQGRDQTGFEQSQW